MSTSSMLCFFSRKDSVDNIKIKAENKLQVICWFLTTNEFSVRNHADKLISHPEENNLGLFHSPFSSLPINTEPAPIR